MSDKYCTSCGLVKSTDLFSADRRYKSGYRSQCRQCRASTPSAKRAKLSGHLRRIYGLTHEEWEEMYKAQSGVCAICKLPETRITRPNAKTLGNGDIPRLSVDHDHETGRVRGLLCYKCNIGIGHLQDSIEILQEAIEYLKRQGK